ncbi:MAG: 30S ribosomal protein S12 methylthiotransferase RimO [Muribaculaceae bacterium]|nr:30S ribosomal protein S12 methylthiotransferase RimO [Muribaculaceae bacterium]
MTAAHRNTARRVNIITMGCAKNLVDSERLARMFREAGIDVVFDADGFSGGDVVINTCGFIGDAKEESIEMILNAAASKEAGGIGRIFVMGCLSERYRSELPSEIPEVDAWFGKFDWPGIVKAISPGLEQHVHPWERVLSKAPHSAFIKIAEGCNRYCAYCAIPLITGRYRSRAPEEILEEVRSLAASGTKDFNIIAQDLSDYGRDIAEGRRSLLAQLIEDMSAIPGVEMIRLHYAYPADFPYDILPVMAANPKVCRYLDIALQHISDPVLENMRRHIDGKATRELLARIRREVPGIHIRTTLMTGFPGEGPEQFRELCDFVREQLFERMGAFAYCEEDDTFAARNLEDSIPDEVKQSRLDEIMAIQQEISLELNRKKIGSVMRAIIDGETDEYYLGRTEFDSPEVDPGVLIAKSRVLKPGDIVNVRITDAEAYDLYAELDE